MKRSHHIDEQVFQKLRASGKTSWDEQADPAASFDRFVMRPFLEHVLATIDRPPKALSALEIGCGSGPVCCFLAEQGLRVRGIDVSPTALEMARQNAAERGLNVQFDLADICHLPDSPDRYDLIIDGHCLHCIVAADDRRRALTALHHLLKPGGLLLIETMIAHPDLVVKGNYRIDPQGVLSIRVDDPAGNDGAFQSDGAWFAPYRRLRTETQMVAELEDRGFALHKQEAAAQADGHKPMLMRVVAGQAVTR